MALNESSLNASAGVNWSLELERHARWLRAVLLTRSREPGALDELLQEVALVAVRDGHKLRDPDRSGAWLYRVAVRTALMHRRKLGRQRRLRDSFARQLDGAAAAGLDDANPLAWLLADERSHMIRQAIERLRSRDAEILLLKYTEDWSYRDLAEHLGISEGAVETRLHRARQKLRRELVKNHVVEDSQVVCEAS